MPIDIRLVAAPARRAQPLAAYLADVAAEARELPDAVVVPLPDAEAAGLDEHLGGSVGEVVSCLRIGPAAGDLGQAVLWAGPPADRGRPARLLLVSLGDEGAAAMRRAGAAVARRTSGAASVLVASVADKPDEAVHAFAEGLLLGSYRFSMGPEGPATDGGPPAVGDGAPGPASVRLLASDPERCQAVLDRAAVIAGAVALARDLTNMPSTRKTPDWLAGQAAAVADSGGLSVRVWDEGMLAAEGFGGLLGVGAGSAQPPRLIQLSYSPPGWREHIVLVGKGITFDSGGLSLKPTDGMQTMKTDMAGGGVVIAVMSALAALGVRARVTGLVAAAENMPSGSALRPGDVLTHYGGRTVEVLNTDAEGRLVLADALAYADAMLAPDTLVDIATLTGAVRVALGARTAALFASDDTLAEALLAAAADSGDPLWRMPLVEDYRDALDSPVADLGNVSRSGGTRPGAIDAALFLREFAGGRRWAHLDVAGAARAAADDGEISKGATGFGTRLLLAWLAPAAGADAP